jgi:hypothetical protein
MHGRHIDIAARCALGLALAALVASPAAYGRGTIPKGYAYAAEARVTVVYDGVYQRDTDQLGVPCNNGDQTSVAELPSREIYVLKRTVLFRHITVPVVPPGALGRAARRLALRPTITTPGTVTSELSGYSLTGSLLPNGESSCATAPYSCKGSIANTGGLTEVVSLGDRGFLPNLYELSIAGNQVANPVSCDAGGVNDVLQQLTTDAAFGTRNGEGFGLVVVQRGLAASFDALRRRSSFTISDRVRLHNPPSCQMSGVTCSQEAFGTARVVLKRLFLYRTKRSYAK